MPDLDADAARRFWLDLAPDVAAGRRILLVAETAGDASGAAADAGAASAGATGPDGSGHDRSIAGTAQLELIQTPNQPHRAEVHKVLVHSSARRRGVARALMSRIEEEARAAGRGLLVLDTVRGDPGEALYRSMGWVEVGAIPDFALRPDGSLVDTVVFYKRV